MLLVVVGLLVLVLVILVVVFLSVRSMRAAEEDDYEDHPAPRRSSRGGRDDDEEARPRGASRGRQSRPPARRGSAQNDRDNAYAHSGADYEDDPQRRVPRPRGYQHDQDQRPESRRAARSQPRQAAARLTGGDRDRSGRDWADTDWGGVSDEQYWAELSSDKPLATTARSAQPASADRAATTAMAAATGTRAATFGRQPEPGEDGAAADSWGPAEPRTFGDPLSMQSRPRLDDHPPAAEINETDPGLGRQAGWPGRADDSVSTAAWTATSPDPGRDWAAPEPQDESWGPHDPPAASSPGWHDPGESSTAPWSAQDAAVAAGTNWADEPSAADWGEPAGPAWNGDHATPAWNDEQTATSWSAPEDPLTSPSFSTADGYSSDSRSYRRSHDRARAQYESSPDVFNGERPDYTGSHSNGNGYAASWPGSGDDYPGGSHDQLEPLPEPGASPESWHSAPVSSGDSRFYTEPAAQPWDQAGTGYDDASRHRSGGPGQDDGYPSQDYRDWPGTDAGYQQSAGYEPSHGQGLGNGYGQGYGQSAGNYEPDYGSTAGYGADHDDSGYGSNGNGYSLPTRDPGPAATGYGHENGYGQHSRYDNDRWQ